MWQAGVLHAARRIEGGRNGGRGGSKRGGVPGSGLEQYEVSRSGKLTFVRLRILTYVAIGVLAVVGVMSAAWPTTDSANAASQLCVPSPDAGVVRLVVVPGSVAAGQAVHFRIDNSRGPTLTYGADYSIQQCVAGVWKLAPFSPTAFTRQLIQQRPSRGRWQRVPIPTTATVGEYRLRKSVSDGMGARWLYCDFDVVAHPSAQRAGVLRNPPGASPTAK